MLTIRELLDEANRLLLDYMETGDLLVKAAWELTMLELKRRGTAE